MIALSARFSHNEYFGSIPREQRGKPFAQKATALYAERLQRDAINESSLAFLQGCILLAFYLQTCEITTRGWLLIGTCCQLGIDLGLDRVDKDVTVTSSTSTTADGGAASQWSYKEEKRRAWWLVWELDVFTATILRRRRGISIDQMNILLPVSDSAWFSDTPTRSTFLVTDYLHTWQTLEAIPEADERAWFLVTSYMMAVAANLTAPDSISTLQDVLSFESTLDCFALLLPEAFRLDLVRFPFGEESFALNNWAFLTIFMLHRSVPALAIAPKL